MHMFVVVVAQGYCNCFMYSAVCPTKGMFLLTQFDFPFVHMYLFLDCHRVGNNTQ